MQTPYLHHTFRSSYNKRNRHRYVVIVEKDERLQFDTLGEAYSTYVDYAAHGLDVELVKIESNVSYTLYKLTEGGSDA